ncbi:uncharacterized protein CELE_Y71G12A.5 [Caenorhabditis elegans]|uniref:Uncharacterized protein n=1 Tax=Caenorhabditis elegans TaxID=6239 RepID=A0A2K5ATN8_CAEEL|nr:Uncharacterized protein CELE_Y71G12A.5 [Caenorhabditis elegans]SPC47142.1 Uncharacterized protein CELE_Y71G12A.5 [Caenorhabditis elegans]|eukprot:NP_001348690.1 Uncharacterized protein CELE_Y71G12A.5 [Caenorhabditis elegans]
MRFIFNFTL